MNVCKPSLFVLDVDGVLTTGQFIYTLDGKFGKIFGPDDNDALKLIEPYLEILFVTGDKKGFDISKRRIVHDMGYHLELVSTIRRSDWLKARYSLSEIIYMGDGIFDHYVMKKVGYSIAPQNADTLTRNSADYVTSRHGGERAVAEACLHILEKFFNPYDPEMLPASKTGSFGEWAV